MTRSLAVVCEAPADRETAGGLADRVFCTDVDWITEELLDAYRKWRGVTDNDSHLLWREVPELARKANLRAHGHFNGEPGAPDAHAARKALLLLKLSDDKPDGVLLIRDDDRQTERRRGLEQARDTTTLGVPVVIGLAHPNRECWVLAGFDPCHPDEELRLEQLRQELGFDPCSQAEALTAKHDHEARSAKRALARLTGNDWNREAACWQDSDLKTLEQRGHKTGLAAYLQELRTHLVPLFL